MASLFELSLILLSLGPYILPIFEEGLGPQDFILVLQELLHLLSSLFLLYLLGCSHVLIPLVLGSRRELELQRLTPLLARRGYVEDPHCIREFNLFLGRLLFRFFIQS